MDTAVLVNFLKHFLQRLFTFYCNYRSVLYFNTVIPLNIEARLFPVSLYTAKYSLREKCPNLELFLVRIQENTDQK